jgi:putative DNA methylase
MLSSSVSAEHAKAITSFLALTLDKIADANNSLCHYEPVAQCPRGLFCRQSVPMVWDFGEVVPISKSTGSWLEHSERALDSIKLTEGSGAPAVVARASATQAPWDTQSFDAIITDPPYYDNVTYSNLADFFFVWLKRSLGRLFPEHFAGQATPKKAELIAAFYRHGNDKAKSRLFYERGMAEAFREAHRLLKPTGQLTIVYAHKTTLGWATLVQALRSSGFTVLEAWPLSTETRGRLIAQDTAALASSIFLVARKRDSTVAGNYEEQVRPELEQIVRERVETLWDMGISGADLVIACVGAGLRAFTQFASVEYANGQEVPAERFLAEVETVVLETILARLSKEVGGNGGKHSLAGLDAATRFYVLWRYTYKTADLDAGEAIIFANGTHVELDGQDGLSSGANAILQKNKAKYRLRDFTERGDDDDLGLPGDDGETPPTVDALHRLLWLLEHKPPRIPQFLADTGVRTEQLRLVAQALAGPALKGGELADVSPSAEQAALGKLLSNWNAVVEGKAATSDRQKGQERLL